MEEEQPKLFEVPQDWKQAWVGMPDFDHKDLEPKQTILLHFKNYDDAQKLSKLIGQTITEDTKFLWYPKAEIIRVADKRYIPKEELGPRYPIYIISKGRWESRLTSKVLEEINVPYRIVIEPQEYDNYASVIEPKKILNLPFSNLGQGSIPARNWVWDHSISEGHKRHWILDDNIYDFWRFHDNKRVRVSSGNIFRAAEDFTERYENVAQSGMQYYMFITNKDPRQKPFLLNTRVYSCIHNSNNLHKHRWRGRYNEDTDLSIRLLKDGWCTILFNAFLARKATTMTMKGGNTDELYKDDGRRQMAQSLVDQHPDITRIAWKWGRYQHHVNYSIFKVNKLIPRKDLDISKEANNYGMEMKIFDENITLQG